MDHTTEHAPPALDDPRTTFAMAVSRCGEAIASVQPDQHHLSTPTDMDVAQLCEHLVMVLRRVACAGRGESPLSWPVDAADVAEGEWLAAWTEAAHEVRAAWGDEVLLRPTLLPWDEFSGTEVLGVYTNELVVHTWDLARATGQQVEWDAQVLEVALAAIHAQLPVADRTEMWAAARAQVPEDYPWEDPFGPAVEVPDDAPAIDRLVAWNGRQP